MKQSFFVRNQLFHPYFCVSGHQPGQKDSERDVGIGDGRPQIQDGNKVYLGGRS